MLDPIQEYKITKDIDKIKDIAYFECFEKYIKLNLKGQEKQIQIDDTDQEHLIINLNGGRPIPGNVYTFIYGGEKTESIIIDGKPKNYIDLIPLVFCFNVLPDGFNGINFNMIPPYPRMERIKFFKALYDTFKIYYDNVENYIENNKLSINEQFLAIVRSGKGGDLLKKFNSMAKTDFSYAFRRYKSSIITGQKIRMVEIPEWKYIPFYESRETFKKINDKIIQSNFGKNI